MLLVGYGFDSIIGEKYWLIKKYVLSFFFFSNKIINFNDKIVNGDEHGVKMDIFEYPEK